MDGLLPVMGLAYAPVVLVLKDAKIAIVRGQAIAVLKCLTVVGH